MTVNMFLFMLLVFASISSLITESIKTFIKDKANLVSNIIVLIVSLVVGSVGMVIYYVLNDMTIGSKEIIYIGLMSIATWLSSMGLYDKICQTLTQCREGLKAIASDKLVEDTEKNNIEIK